MSAVLILFCLGLLHVCGSSEGLKNISAEPGQNVTLPCKAENKYTLIVLEWTREGLGKKNVFVFKDGRPYPAAQHESFKNRVSPKDPQMKDGDLSVVLKNVKIEDSGTYQCRVKQENDPERELRLISSIRLMVFPPSGEEGGQEGGGDEKNKETWITVGVLLAVVVLVLLAVGFLIYKMIRAPNQTPRDSNDQQNAELDELNPDSNTERNTENN